MPVKICWLRREKYRGSESLVKYLKSPTVKFCCSSESANFRCFVQLFSKDLQHAKLLLVPPKCQIIMEQSNYLSFSIAPYKVKINFLYYFFDSFLYFPFYSCPSLNCCNGDSCWSFLLSNFSLPSPFTFKIEKELNYCYQSNWKSDNFTQINTV